MADEYKFPMRLRMAMERDATVLTNCSAYSRRELDEDSQLHLRGVLDDLDSACVEANMVVRRAPRSRGLRIRVGHSTAGDYETGLYQVVRGLNLGQDVAVSLPHAGGATGDCTKSFFAAGCDLFIAEVSSPSTGLGMELAYADMMGVPVACIHRSDCKPSSLANMVAKLFLSYDSPEQLARHIQSLVDTARPIRGS